MAAPEQPRTLISITGSDAAGFLQNLVTNDITKADLTYTALLTPQGKYLADFFVVQQGDGFLVDVATTLASGLAQRLTMYRLRADVVIAESDQSVSVGLTNAPDGALADPRDPALGWRYYGPAVDADPVDWAALRVDHMIPETGAELTGDSYILEAGFERLSGVDFKKGCYVGQEVTARMKHKTELKKGLVQLAIAGTAPVGSEIKSNGKTVGTLFTQANGLALAHVRFDRVTDDMTAGDATLNPV